MKKMCVSMTIANYGGAKCSIMLHLNNGIKVGARSSLPFIFPFLNLSTNIFPQTLSVFLIDRLI